MLLFGTSAFGNELGDRTLVYLVLKPLPRWRIVRAEAARVAARWAACRWRSAALLAVARDRGRRRRRRARDRARPRFVGAAAVRGDLHVGRASPPGTRWSSGSSTSSSGRRCSRAYLDGIRFLSVRQFTLALIHGLDGERLATLDLSLGAGAGRDRRGGRDRRLLRAHGAQAHPHRRAVEARRPAAAAQCTCGEIGTVS